MTAPTSLTPAERETILNLDDESGVVRIWTAQRTVLTALRSKAGSGALEMISHGHHGTTEWAEFRLDTRAEGAYSFNLAGALRAPRTLSDEQRASLSDRMKALRAEQQAAK